MYYTKKAPLCKLQKLDDYIDSSSTITNVSLCWGMLIMGEGTQVWRRKYVSVPSANFVVNLKLF